MDNLTTALENNINKSVELALLQHYLRLVKDGAISQYKAVMLIKHGADWVDDGLDNANQ